MSSAALQQHQQQARAQCGAGTSKVVASAQSGAPLVTSLPSLRSSCRVSVAGARQNRIKGSTAYSTLCYSIHRCQTLAGIDVGAYEHGDADLASLLGPIAADVGGMDLFPAPPVLSVSAASRRSHSALELASRLAARPSPASVGSAVPSRHHLPSLLDGLSLQQAVPGTGCPATHQQQHAPALQQQDSSVLEPLVRCLWHCAAFRQMVLTWPEIVHKSDPVVNALHTTFLAYRDSAAQSGPITTACTAALADMLAGHQLFGTGVVWARRATC
jgi:hypothetical protein